MIISKNRIFFIITCTMLFQASSIVHATLLPLSSPAKTDAILTQPIHIQFTKASFIDVATVIEQKSKIKIQIVPPLQNHLITADIQAKSWAKAIAGLLKGYNHIGFIGANGQIKRILVTGINGNGSDAIKAPEGLINYPDNNVLGQIPDHLKQLPEGSVLRVAFNKSMLKNMALGDVLPLSLPAGQFNVVHDNIIFGKNGDFTWIGYLEGITPKKRVIISFGNNDSFGRILTPEGVFRVETSAGVDWLVDVDSAGLNPGPLREDMQLNPPSTIEQPGIGEAVNPPTLRLKPQQTTAYATNITSNARDLKYAPPILDATAGKKPVTVTSNASSEIIIDVMVLYTEGLQTTRINNLIATTNQAFKDSGVQIQLRLVHTQRVNYTNHNLNKTALYDLTYGQGTLTDIAALRETHGADLVNLLRPFVADAQQGCGLAWIGGSGGRNFNAGEAYSVVSDGIDDFHYCTDYTFAHELSHNMGSSHDRENARYFGKFPYSYGININDYGTIMSYSAIELGLFSNPDIVCLEQTCGIDAELPNAANNALSLNNSAATIAAFMKPANKQSISKTGKKNNLQ
jgi:Metallo-peptidase family M12B Reprolysin-like